MIRRLLGAAVLAASLTAGTAQAAETYYVIAHAGVGDPYWALEAKGAEDAGKFLGVRAVFAAPEVAGSISKMLEILNGAIAANPAGIAVTISDPQAVSGSIKAAVSKGIPILAIDTAEGERDPVNLPYTGYVGVEERVAGRQVASKLLQRGVASGARVVVANHQPGVISLELRTKGVEDVFGPKGITVDTLDITSNPTQGITILGSYLTKNPNTAAIITLGPLGYTAAGKLLEEKGLGGKVHLTGFDMDPVGIQLIKKGIMDFTVDAQPYMQAFLSVMQLYLASHYKMVPVDISTGAGFVDKENIGPIEELIAKGYR